MNAILFRLVRQTKNWIKDLVYHPGKLITYLILTVLIGFSLISNLMESSSMKVENILDIRILHAGYLAAVFALFVFVLMYGLQQGTSFFESGDVNLLFVSPVSPRTILTYGLLQQMASNLLIMLFLVFYSAMLSNLFGIQMWQIVYLILGLAFTLLTAQVCTLVLFNMLNGRPKAKKVCTALIYLFIGVGIGSIAVPAWMNGANVEALLTAASTSALRFLPVAGWIKAAVFGGMYGDFTALWQFGALSLLFLAIVLAVFFFGSMDYYEDVLSGTERAKMRKVHKSLISQDSFRFTTKKIRLKNQGIKKGFGADVFFYKHLCEERRRGSALFFNGFTLFMAAIDIVLAYFFTNGLRLNDEGISNSWILLILLALDAYLLFFGNMAGSWTTEIKHPFLFLVPESAFKKLIWATMTTLIKPALDGLLIFPILGIILHANWMIVVTCILVYATMGAIYLAVNLLFQKIIGKPANEGLMLMLYMLLLMAIEAVPVIATVVLLVVTRASAPVILLFLPMILWNAIGTGLIYWLCKDIAEQGMEV